MLYATWKIQRKKKLHRLLWLNLILLEAIESICAHSVWNHSLRSKSGTRSRTAINRYKQFHLIGILLGKTYELTEIFESNRLTNATVAVAAMHTISLQLNWHKTLISFLFVLIIGFIIIKAVTTNVTVNFSLININRDKLHFSLYNMHAKIWWFNHQVTKEWIGEFLPWMAIRLARVLLMMMNKSQQYVSNLNATIR